MKSLGPAAFHGPIKHGPDPSDLGHPIPLSLVIGRNEVAVVGVTAFIAYHKGFAFTITMLFADPQNRLTPLHPIQRVTMAQVRGEDSPPSAEQFRIVLTFSDWSSLQSSCAFFPEAHTEPPLTL